MKNLAVLFLLVTTVSYSQNFSGKAIYKTQKNISIKLEGDNPLMQKQLEEKLKKYNQVTYELVFTKTESIYKQVERLEAPTTSNTSAFKIFGNSGVSILYKNIAKKKYKKQNEIFGKPFLVADDLPQDDWKLSSETKKIGEYTCYKATKTKEVENISYSFTDGKKDENKTKVTVETVAWYTPQIPVSHGPNMYGGLPGLILAVQQGKKTILCEELILNPKDEPIKIKVPSKGKKISQAAFDKIQKEKFKDMLERFQSKKGKNGSGISISK